MKYQNFEDFRASVSQEVKDTCAHYGLNGCAVYYNPSPVADSSRNRLYIIAGVSSVYGSESAVRRYTPEEILRQVERNGDLFYPNRFAFDLSETPDQMHAMQALVDYCKKAEFIKRLYAEYNLASPERLRLSEVTMLGNLRGKLDNPRANDALKKKCKKDLDWFFKREKSSGFRRRWLNYFRSSKFPKDKGPLAKLRGYYRRDDNRLSLDQLTDGSGDLRKIEMQEFEFKLFEKLIKERQPDVLYVSGDKSIVDHGLIGRPFDENGPFGKPVTFEEYAVIRKERFATEGWNAVAKLSPSYWEFRDVYYKAADEPLIAGVYNSIVLQYAKCNPLSELKKRGNLCLQKIPAADFMNFVSLAKENKLRFYIDNLGEYEFPSLKTVNVIYNEHQQDKMSAITSRIIDDKVNFSHVLDSPSNPPLSSMIEHYSELSKCDVGSRIHRKEPPAIE